MAKHVCPYWVGWLLISPLRKFAQNPERILSPYVREGMTILEVGPGMGFFSLPLARLVGPAGRVVCVDLQERMITALRRRAERAELIERMDLRVGTDESLCLNDEAGTVDFALVFAVAHEVGDLPRFFSEIHTTLKPGGVLFLAEPKGHVGAAAFEKTVGTALERGFAELSRPAIRRSRGALLKKNL